LRSILTRLFRLAVPRADLDSIKYRLNQHIQVADWIVTAGLLIGVLKYKLNFDFYFPSALSMISFERWRTFVSAEGTLGLLALVVAWTYKNFRKNTASEMDVMAGMFWPVPQRWDRVEGHRQLKWLIAMWVGVSLLLVWFLNHPHLFSATVMIYAGCSVYGMVLYRRNISRYFDDPRFLPAKDDNHAGFIRERRRIQSIYLDKHHHLKEVMLFTGAAAAFVTASPSVLPIRFSEGIANDHSSHHHVT
jgi:hypothetical protein